MNAISIGLSVLVLSPIGVSAATTYNVNLATAETFAVLAASTVTNTGITLVDGNLGVWPGTAVTGFFPPGVVIGGTIHAGDAVAQQAQMDLTTAYNYVAGQACTMTLTGQDLGGLTLTSGVYCFTSSAQLTGTLTLDAQGDPTSVFLFLIGSTLTTAPGSSVQFTGGGQGGGVFWQVGSSATLDTTTAFAGNILAHASITLNTGATINCGRALASTGAVTMDSNTVSINSAGCLSSTSGGEVPEPSTASLLLLGGALGLLQLKRWRSRARKAGANQ